MNEKIEGTFFLDGLIEGRLPAEPDAEEELRCWVRNAAREHLKFSLDIDGGNFSLLPNVEPVAVDDLVEDPTHAIQHAMENLLEIFPLPERSGVQSTLRSTEYREHLEMQTIYAVAPDGTILTRKRNLEAETTPPPKPLSLREKLKLTGFGLIIILGLIGISAIFVDYRALYRDIAERVTPLDASTIEVRMRGFEGLICVTRLTFDPKRNILVLTVQRDVAFPADLATACAEEKNVTRRLALEALLHGYAYGEQFDTQGNCIGFTLLRIAPLRDRDETELVLPLPRDVRPVKIVIGF